MLATLAPATTDAAVRREADRRQRRMARCAGPTARAPLRQRRARRRRWSPDGPRASSIRRVRHPRAGVSGSMPTAPAGSSATGSRWPATPARRTAESTASAPCAARRDGSLRALEDERHERQQPDAGEERSADEEQPVTCVAPVQHDPADCEDAVQRRSARGHVSERKHGCRERGGHPEARVEPARDRGAEGEGGDELGRPEGKECRAEDGRHDAERYGDDAPRVSLSGSERLFGLLRRAVPCAPAGSVTTAAHCGALPRASRRSAVRRDRGRVRRRPLRRVAEGDRGARSRAVAHLPGSRARLPGSERPRTDVGR